VAPVAGITRWITLESAIIVEERTTGLFRILTSRIGALGLRQITSDATQGIVLVNILATVVRELFE
jgi:hypothetical protein